MDDILFGNNNKVAISRLAKRNYLSNKRRNRFVVIALALTAMMITSIFSIGFSYTETFQMQQVRYAGTAADAAVTNITDSQIKMLGRSSEITDVGLSVRLGGVDTSQLKDAKLGLVWIDKTEWEVHRQPSISDLYGSYPKAESEIMLPTWVLEQMGITKPEAGMEIPLSYQIGNSREYTDKTFTLSGYYTDYLYVRSNNRGTVYVSEAFKNSQGISVGSTAAMISFEDSGKTKENCIALKNRIGLTADQEVEIVPAQTADTSGLTAAMAAIILFIMFSGYLLIYNIMYISISRDTRFYGQLKTIGTTKRQIRRIVRIQVFKMASVGITSGLLAGAAISYGVVPYALKMMYAGNGEMGTKISFSPFIFVGAAIFTLLTAILGSMKPAKIAGRISPAAAMRYLEVSKRKPSFKKTQGIKLHKVAFDNIFRNKKSAMLVFASLVSGLCLFLITAGILSSLSPEEFIKDWGESDFVMSFDYYTQEEEMPITEEMLAEIKDIDGAKDVRVTYSAAQIVYINYDNDVFFDYVKSLEGRGGLKIADAADAEKYGQNFFSLVYGIDREYMEELNQTMEQPVDIDLFENSNLVLLADATDASGKKLIKPGEKITAAASGGESIFTVADAALPDDFQSERDKWRGSAPDMYMSTDLLKKTFPQNRIFRIAFNTSGEKDREILERLKDIAAKSAQVTIISRYEKRAEINNYIVTLKVLGIGMSLVVLLIGVTNFINTMAVSVNTRKYEFAVLESIGMTKKQIKRVLIYEGGYYWAISIVLAAVVGTGGYVLLYNVFKQIVPYAVFRFPVSMAGMMAVFVLVICLIVPAFIYGTDIKENLAERLRNNN